MKFKALREWASLPFVWMMIIPSVILDIFLEVYHHITFPLYGIKLVKRKNYIKIDRHKLKYLNWHQKLGCVYCGYVNGLVHYATAITAKTEAYWCAIMHKKIKGFVAPEHHKAFAKYGSEEDFRKKYHKNRPRKF